LLKGFRPGDVMRADALYCNYFVIATLMAAGVEKRFCVEPLLLCHAPNGVDDLTQHQQQQRTVQHLQ